MKTGAHKNSTKFATPIPQHAWNHPLNSHLLALVAMIATLVAAMSLSSCAGYTTNAAGSAGSQGGPGSGILSASTGTVDFGNVDVGSTGTQALTLTNTGTASVSISNVSVSGAGFSVMGGNFTGTVLAGQSVSLQFQFAPQSTGSLDGSVTIASNASSTSEAAGTSSPIVAEASTTSNFKIKLHGNAVQALISLSPSSLNFNNVTAGQSSSQAVKLINNGTADLHLQSATVTGITFSVQGLSTPQTVPAGQSISFSVQYAPTGAGSASGKVALADNAPNAPQTLILTGNAVAPGGTLLANPGSYNFSNVVVGSSSQQTITLTNSGAGTVTINSISATGAGFSATGLSANQTIAAGAKATFTASFAPVSAGNASGTIVLATDASNPTLAIALSGTGTEGALSSNPASVNFGSILVGSSSTATITLTNSGTAPVSVSAASPSGAGFSVSGFTSGTLNPGGTSSFSVVFAPAAAGSTTGTVSVTSDAPGSPLKVSLSGIGTATQAQLSVSPASVSFSNVNVGGSASQTVTLTNTGNAALNITAAAISGPGYTTTLAPMTINAGANTAFSVNFAPTAEGSAPGSISITSNAPGSPASIALTGTGMEALGSASPASVAFGGVVVGNSNSQVIILKNTGNATLSFSQVSVSGQGFSISGLTTSSTIAAGSSLNFNAVFAPASASSSTGSITLTTNGSPSQISISLSGSGTAATQTLSVSSSSLTFGNVQVGNNSSLTTTVTNTGNSDVSISGVTVTGATYTASGVTSGMVLSPNQSVTLTVNFAPAALGNDPGTVSIASNATNSPADISVTGESHTVLLSWTGSTSTSVTGYYVYRGTQLGQYTKIDPSSPATGAQFTDTGVAAATTYYYVVTAVDSSGVESSYSTPATVSVP